MAPGLPQGQAVKTRITRLALADPETLKPHELNWRDHPQAQRDALEVAMRNLGWIKRVIVNETTGHLIDGHLRVEQAKRLGLTAIPVAYVALSPAQEAVALATLDPISLDAETDERLLRELVEGVSGSIAPELDGLLRDLAKQQGVAIDAPDKPELSKAPRKIECPRCGHDW